MRSDVVVVGSANADLVVEVPRRPGGGETLLGGELRTLPGGKGANQAAAAARSGANVSFLGCVGRDGNGEFLRERLAAAGVRTDSLVIVERPSGTAVIFVTPDGENSIVVSPGANAEMTVERLRGASGVLGAAKVVVISLEIPLATAVEAARIGDASGARVLFNAAPSVRLDPDTLRLCDPLVVNEHEARDVLGAGEGSDFRALAEGLRDAGARSVVITLGEHGALVLDDEGCSETPAYRVRAVDTTGAGDAFVGVLAAELAAGKGLRRAVGFATAVSAVAVQRMGAQPSYAERTEVEEFMRAHAPMG